LLLLFDGIEMDNLVRRLGNGLGTVVLLGGLAAVGIFGFSATRLNRTYELKTAKLAIPSDAAAIARGRHLAVAIGRCVDCHGTMLEGKLFFNDGAMGRLVASNLTRGKGGVAAQYDDEKWVRAIRHGIKSNGKPALSMPSQEFHDFTDADLADLVAYVKSVPPVDNELPRTRILLVARAQFLGGLLPLVSAELVEHDAPPPTVTPAVTAEYGAYLATVGGCKGCHGANLGGGRVPGTPPEFPSATNITPAGIGAWSEQDFFRALREGVRPNGTAIDPFMPWQFAGQMTDAEIRAIWLYLRTVPAAVTRD
jgi:mono/diheme cytochrome c family protein